ncbi:hypothetical protein MHYP_G00039540 [Metynnis hypsauchen]
MKQASGLGLTLRMGQITEGRVTAAEQYQFMSLSKVRCALIVLQTACEEYKEHCTLGSLSAAVGSPL